MKLPSLNKLTKDVKNAVLRFPLSTLSAVVGTLVAIILIEIGDIEQDIWLFNVLLISALGLTTFISVQLISERSRFPKVLFILGGFSFLSLMYWTLPGTDYLFNRSVPYIRYGVFNAIAHLLVATVPFSGRGQINGFWNYNKALFLRIVTTLFYSGVIFLGIALALGAINVLFDADIKGERFAECFVIIVGVFNTLFFLSGVPSNWAELDGEQNYPRGLKVFTQFILLPLLTIYLVILYAYGSKIVIFADWPQGIVSYMVSAVSILGILTLLLLYPVAVKRENIWVNFISKYYFYAIIPLVVLLFLAVGMRIETYGVTINRYLVVVLGIWLSLVCLYFIAVGRNIKFVPLSLMIILLATSFGPWGMFSLSERSQVRRLQVILSEAKIVEDGKVQNEMELPVELDFDFYDQNEFVNNNLISDSLKNEVRSILDYLNDFHSFEAIDPFFKQDINAYIVKAKLSQKNIYLNEARVYMHIMGLEYRYYYNRKSKYVQTYTINGKNNNIVEDVSKVDYIVNFHLNRANNQLDFILHDEKYTLQLAQIDSSSIMLSNNNEQLQLDLEPIVNEIWSASLRQYFFNTDIIKRKMALKNTAIEFVIKEVKFKKEPSFKITQVKGDMRVAVLK